MLPNLSLLTIDVTTRGPKALVEARQAASKSDSEGDPEESRVDNTEDAIDDTADGLADANDNNSPTQKKQRRDDKQPQINNAPIDWTREFAATTGNESTFTFTVPRRNDDTPWEVTMKLKDGLMRVPQRQESDAEFGVDLSDCVSIELDYGSDSLHLNDLFYDVTLWGSKKNLKRCKMTPDVSSQRGHGAAILDIVDVIASNHEYACVTLVDAARLPKTSEAPPPDAGSLSRTLALLRGYGYYEARGFVPTFFANHVKLGDMQEMRAVMETNLMWTHVVTTTPLATLSDAIRNFHTNVIATNSGGMPAVLRTWYSRGQCEYKGETAATFVARFMGKFRRDAKMPRTRLQASSMRTLAKVFAEEQYRYVRAYVSKELQTFMKDVWTIQPTQEIFTNLTKVYFDTSFLSIEPDVSAALPPLVRVSKVRTDIVVDRG